MKVSILTRSLTRGGAQVQVVTLAASLARRGHDVSIVVFYGGGALSATASNAGVRVVDLGKSGRFSFFTPVRRLAKHLRDSRADVIYSFLAMENLFGLVAARLVKKPLVWGVRGAGVNRGQYGLASRILYGLQFRLMRRADAVISNSRTAADEIGVSGARALHVVANGIDTDKYSPSAEMRRAWRAMHGFSDDRRVIAIVARLDPMKDHGNFFAAAVRVGKAISQARFVIAGSGPAEYESALRRQAQQLGIADRLLWLGELPETVDLYRGIDLLVSASAYGEGFSNAIGEGMACGVATVTTDVGDGRVVVGPHGRIVPARSPGPLAEAMIEMLSSDDDAARAARRRWIVEQFGVETMVTRTEGILAGVAAQVKEG